MPLNTYLFACGFGFNEKSPPLFADRLYFSLFFRTLVLISNTLGGVLLFLYSSAGAGVLWNYCPTLLKSPPVYLKKKYLKWLKWNISYDLHVYQCKELPLLIVGRSLDLYIRIKNYISTEFKLNNKKMKHNFLKHKRKRYLFRYFRTGLRLTFLLYLIH